jgi:acetate kinase
MSGPAGLARGARRVLVLNPGSSSLKASLVAPPDDTLARTEVSWGADASRHGDRSAGLAAVLERLELDGDGVGSATAIDAVAYRVVHGGARFSAPVRLDDAVLEAIRAVSDLAPLHNGVAIETIVAGRAHLPHVPHVACFDTAFHATLDEATFRYPVPETWYREWGLRRFGFHGLSVAWSTERTAALLGARVDDLQLVVAHLGSGCSVTAVAAGRSAWTSMGLTPLEGLMMGTRSGSIDPGLMLHVLSHGLLTTDELGETLDHASGLLGVSGRSSDMRELSAAAQAGDGRATLAIDMFVARAAAAIAAAATALQRLDAIVFTGGIGEHASDVRRRIVDRLGAIGVTPLPDTSHAPDDGTGGVRLDARDGPVAVLRIEAREDLVIARQSLTLVDEAAARA